MLTVKDILVAAKARIATEATWTRYVLARNAEGEQTRVDSDDACKFCAYGAVSAVTLADDPLQAAAVRALRAAAETLYGEGVAYVNDRIGFAAVHHVFDLAITRAA